MTNRLIVLARFDRGLRKTTLIRWIARVILVSLLLLALINSSSGGQSVLFGLFFLLLPGGILLDIFRLFLRHEVGKEERRQAKNRTKPSMSYATALILVESEQSPKRLWYYLTHNEGIRFVLLRFGFTSQQFYEAATKVPEYNTWLAQAHQLAQTRLSAMAPRDLFEIMQTFEPFAHLWSEHGITTQTRADVWAWWERIELQRQQASRGFTDSLTFSGGIGRDWSSGYTQLLETYATDLTKSLQGVHHALTLIGHTEERQKLLEYLSRDHSHNVVLLGPDGIGKERLIYSLAANFNAGTVPLSLRYKHLHYLDVGRVISDHSELPIESRLQSILDEAAHIGNIILVIPDLQLLLSDSQSSGLGTVNASSLLSEALRSPFIQVIGVMTPEAYYRSIKPNPTLEPLLTPIEVKEIRSLEALQVLEDELPRYEHKTKALFTYQALVKIISIADRHVHDSPYPEKAIQLLDTVAAHITPEQPQAIFARDVERILSDVLKIPMGAVPPSERTILNNLESQIQSHIVGQTEAVSAVANALRRARAGLTSGKRPIGTFLFLGPTGVGKTEMAKTIAGLYFKNPKAFIRLDMSEYQTPESIDKLVGTQTQPGVLTTAVTDQPFSVVLLDEIEKADARIRNLFLQILDDGRVTDGFGKVVDFTNTMIIATSNAGAQLIREAVQQGSVSSDFKATLLDYLQDKAIFAPEWLNRFDAIVTFLSLSKEEIRQVAHLQVQALIEQLKTHNINLTLSDDVYDILIEKGYNPEFGARPMRRAVQEVIENALAKNLLNDESEGMKNITLTKQMLTN